jgi:predicted AAA+ superfamily ATPase
VLQDCIETDIYKRHNIKTENFLKISNYMFLQIAQPFSATNVQNFLKSNNSDDIDYKTIMRYIGWLMEANLLYECEFALTKTKDVLKTNAKYYSVDTGLRNSASR